MSFFQSTLVIDWPSVQDQRISQPHLVSALSTARAVRGRPLPVPLRGGASAHRCAHVALSGRTAVRSAHLGRCGPRPRGGPQDAAAAMLPARPDSSCCCVCREPCTSRCSSPCRWRALSSPSRTTSPSWAARAARSWARTTSRRCSDSPPSGPRWGFRPADRRGVPPLRPREGGAKDTSPVAARMSVAAGCLATRSLREGDSTPQDVPALDPELLAYVEAGQEHPAPRP